MLSSFGSRGCGGPGWGRDQVGGREPRRADCGPASLRGAGREPWPSLLLGEPGAPSSARPTLGAGKRMIVFHSAAEARSGIPYSTPKCLLIVDKDLFFISIVANTI